MKYSNLRNELKKIQIAIIKESIKNKLKEDKAIKAHYLKYLKSCEHSRYKYINNILNEPIYKSTSIPPFENYITKSLLVNQKQEDGELMDNEIDKSKLKLYSQEYLNQNVSTLNEESPYHLVFQPPIKSLKKLKRLNQRCSDIKSRLNYIGKNSFLNNPQNEMYTHYNEKLLMEKVQTPSKNDEIINRKICSVCIDTPIKIKKKSKRTFNLNSSNELRIRKTLVGISDFNRKKDLLNSNLENKLK